MCLPSESPRFSSLRYCKKFVIHLKFCLAPEECSKLTPEILQQFVSYEKAIKELETKRVEERLTLHTVELNALKEALTKQRELTEDLRKKM